MLGRTPDMDGIAQNHGEENHYDHDNSGGKQEYYFTGLHNH